MSFRTLGLSQALLDAISQKGYSTPSPIQEKSIPEILKRKDLLASAQTGTGKTASFVLPILEILSETTPNPSKHRPIRALILTPTRELAAQVYANIRQYGAFLKLYSTVIYGGVNQYSQVPHLKKGVDILVATPGRLLDLEEQRLLSLSQVEILVLDEADRMLDMGFSKDIERITHLIPKQRQTVMFSATFSPSIKKLANKTLQNPVQIEIIPDPTTADNRIEQKIYKLSKINKTAFLTKLIQEGNWQQVLVFTSTKHGANKLCEKLIRSNITSTAIHGNKTQAARTKALASFKNGSVKVLVATDVAARGLDIPLLPHVINFELPNVAENYIHRIGRTGRAGASGEAISLVSPDEGKYLKEIEKLLGNKLPSEIPEGFEGNHQDTSNGTNDVSSSYDIDSRRSSFSRNTSSFRSPAPKKRFSSGSRRDRY